MSPQHPQPVHNLETPESLELDPNGSDLASDSGALGSDQDGYNERETFPSHNPPPTTAISQPARLGRGFWVGLLVAALIILAIVIYGIHARSVDNQTLVIETKSENVPEVKTVFPDRGWRGEFAFTSGKYAGLCGYADLRPHLGLPQKVVLRHRRACAQGPADGNHRNPRA